MRKAVVANRAGGRIARRSARNGGSVRRRAKIDGNQREIVDALVQVGCSVSSASEVGDGFPDLVIGYLARSGPRCTVAEVKRPKGKLTDDQVRWRCKWVGPFVIFRTVDDALMWHQNAKRE